MLLGDPVVVGQGAILCELEAGSRPLVGRGECTHPSGMACHRCPRLPVPRHCSVLYYPAGPLRYARRKMSVCMSEACGQQASTCGLRALGSTLFRTRTMFLRRWSRRRLGGAQRGFGVPSTHQSNDPAVRHHCHSDRIILAFRLLVVLLRVVRLRCCGGSCWCRAGL